MEATPVRPVRVSSNQNAEPDCLAKPDFLAEPGRAVWAAPSLGQTSKEQTIWGM